MARIIWKILVVMTSYLAVGKEVRSQGTGDRFVAAASALRVCGTGDRNQSEAASGCGLLSPVR